MTVLFLSNIVVFVMCCLSFRKTGMGRYLATTAAGQKRPFGSYIKDSMSNSSDKKNGKFIGIGLSLGIAIGSGIGGAFGNPALGIGPGIAIGVVIGALMSKSRR